MIYTITFPENEYETIQNRLAEGKSVYTIRVSKEFNRYKVNDICITPWGEHVIIKDIENNTDIKNYKFYSELSHEQIDVITQYSEFNIIQIELILSDDLK